MKLCKPAALCVGTALLAVSSGFAAIAGAIVNSQILVVIATIGLAVATVSNLAMLRKRDAAEEKQREHNKLAGSSVH